MRECTSKRESSAEDRHRPRDMKIMRACICTSVPGSLSISLGSACMCVCMYKAGRPLSHNSIWLFVRGLVITCARASTTRALGEGTAARWEWDINKWENLFGIIFDFSRASQCAPIPAVNYCLCVSICRTKMCRELFSGSAGTYLDEKRREKRGASPSRGRLSAQWKRSTTQGC